MPAGALIGASAISAAASAYGAHKASSASKEASKTEAEAADKALEFSRGVYDTREQQLSPYRQSGAASLNTFNKLLGIEAPPMNAAPMATDPNHIQPGQPFPASWVPGSPLSGTPQTAPNMGSPVGNPGRTPQPGQTVGNVTIRVKAPDGTIRVMPAGLQTMAMAQGGQVVG